MHYVKMSGETPMEGREKEYAEFQEQLAQEAASGEAPESQPRSKPRKINDERRARSPGIQNNFYDSSTSDFKRPYGT